MIRPFATVNLELLFLLNLVVDWIWLWGTSRIVGVSIPFWRLAAGALLGSMSTVLYYLPVGAPLWGVAAKTLATALVVGITYLSRNPRQFLSLTAVYLAVGGAVAGVGELVGSDYGGAGSSRPRDLLVLAGLVIFGVGSGWLWRLFRRRAAVRPSLRLIAVRVGSREVRIDALIDTGNSLSEPLTGTPVIVVEVEAVRDLLPLGALKAIRNRRRDLEGVPDEWLHKCRLLPYRAVGDENGVMVGFVPDEIAILHGRDRAPCRAVVAVTPTSFGGDGLYRALLPASLVDPAEIRAHHA